MDDWKCLFWFSTFNASIVWHCARAEDTLSVFYFRLFYWILKSKCKINEWIKKYGQLDKIWKWSSLIKYLVLQIYSSVLKCTCYSMKCLNKIQAVFIEKPLYSCIMLVATDDEEEPPAHFIHIGYVLLSSSNWTLNLIYSGNIIFN